jgi:hypothetical protein
MSWFGITLLAVAAMLLVGLLSLIAFLRYAAQQVKDDPEYKAQIAHLHASYAAEETVREDAPWFGTTGLPEDIERDLPKYLRREFGELLLDEGSLAAKDLTYVGRFSEEGSWVHYWRIPARDGEESYAYVEIEPDGTPYTAWGDREPPASGRAD